MQFRITFRLKHPGQLLPFSYQYELSAWIYKLLATSNSEFAQFLHSQGYVSGNKRFKFFVFSNLHIPKFEPLDDRMKILSGQISFVVSFLVPQTGQEVILGLFKEQVLRLGDKISQVDLMVESVQMLPAVQLDGSPIRFQTTSPLVVSKPEVGKNGKLQAQYLSPLDKEYERYFWDNLKDKYFAASAHKLVSAKGFMGEYTFNCLSSSPKSRLLRIKAHTPAETRVKGFMYEFEVSAPPELLRLGLLAGFGTENALGFGAVKVVGGKY